MKILVVAPAWVGDMVMAHCLVQVLAARYPGAEIHLLCPPATQPIARRMPGVTSTHTLNVAHGELGVGERLKVARALRNLSFDQAIVLPNSFKSALVPYWAGIPRRTGWNGEWRVGVLNDRRKLNELHYPLMIERFMALALDGPVLLDKPYPLPRLEIDRDNTDRLLSAHGLRRSSVTVLCPGAEFGPAKRWPAEHYAAVARHALAAGQQVWLLGAPGDHPVCADIEGLCGAGPAGDLINLAGATSLEDVVDLLALADQVVCNDSGLMHVAGAVGRPVVAVFGSTSPEFTPPLGENAQLVRLDLPCSPCFQRICPLGHLDCLQTLTPASVIACLPIANSP